jgi:hypothetical protein
MLREGADRLLLGHHTPGSQHGSKNRWQRYAGREEQRGHWSLHLETSHTVTT